MIEGLKQPYRIHVGSGRHVLDGWINVDLQTSSKAKRPPDIFAPADEIPLPDACASELMAIHLVEHVYLWSVPKALTEWRRLLQPGGLLVLEMPDIVKCAENLLRLIGKGDEKSLNSLAMHGMYGDAGLGDPLMLHSWGWTFKTLKPVLASHGFVKIKEHETQWHPIGKGVRDFRVEARKL